MSTTNHGVTDKAQFDAVLAEAVNAGKGVIIKFTAAWCGPCRMIQPLFESLSKEYDSKVTTVIVDIDVLKDVAEDYAISCMPTFVALQKDYTEVGRVQGGNKESLAKLFQKF